MSLTNYLKGRSLVGILLCILLLVIVFGYGIRANRKCCGEYCFFGPTKTAKADTETCQAEATAEIPADPVKEVSTVK